MSSKIINTKIIAIMFILFVVFSSAYFFNHQMSNQKQCNKTSGKWNSQACAKLIESYLLRDHFLMMNYPDAAHSVELNKIEIIKGDKYLQGHYNFSLKKAKGGDDRGSLKLSMSKIQVLADNKNQLIYFGAPFIINTQGSGVFIYVGLFAYEIKTHKSRHLDSFFLGDRIQNEKIYQSKDNIRIDYKEHGLDQAFSDKPNKSVSVSLAIENINEPSKRVHFKRL
ncbi:MAG: hypothetical protein KAH18_04825 [Psychromonas sp.]|nr:hypothetical protein [Psychromonas sp.]